MCEVNFMKLSICMMVKNEEKYLDKCLSSLRVLMEGLTSELIIVDTGSTDNTVEIAKRYTDKIYFHEWNNNFSEMRNKSISYSSGEWLFIIDADEILVDAANLIKFLNSKDNLKFKAGFLIAKNIVREDDETTVPSFSSVRLFRKGNIRYEGAVHNMALYDGPVADLNIEILHYGYITTDKELMERKFQRTSKILKEEIEKNPANLYYMHQLSVSYRMHGDSKEALEQAIKTYDLLKKSSVNPQKVKFIYYQLALCYYDFSDYENVERICNEGISIEKQYIDLYYYLATAQVYLRKFDSAIKNYKIHIDFIQNYDNLEVRKDFTISMYTLSYIEHDYYSLALCYYAQQDFDQCLIYLEYIKGQKRIGDAINLTIKVILETKKYDRLLPYHNYLISLNTNYKELFIVVLEKNKTALSFEMNKNIESSLLGSKEPYLLLNSIRHEYTLGNKDKVINFIEELFKIININEVHSFYGDIIYYLIKFCEQIDRYIVNLTENKLNDFIFYINGKYKDLDTVLYTYLADNQQNNDDNLYKLMLKKVLQRTFLMVSKPSDTKYEIIFNKYLSDGTKYIKGLYSKSVIDNELACIVNSDEDRFLIYLNKAHEFNSKDLKIYISYLRKALAAFPTMKSGIELLIKQTEGLMKEDKNEKFEEYKMQFKQNINNLISDGLLEESRKLIEKYEKIVSKDIEIYSMKALIAIMENNFEEAKAILFLGLKYEPKNFDLLYSLAYVYEQKGQYNKALIHYKRARKLKYYETTIKIEINKIIESIYKNNRELLEKEYEANEVYRCLNKIENVLFIDFDLTTEVNSLGKSLDEYGINVDLAYSGISPDRRFGSKELPYRKLLGVTNIEHLIEYINYYCYDAVHIFNVPDNIRLYIRERCNSGVVSNDEILTKEINEIIKLYDLNQKVNNKEINKYSSEKSLTILIPTYNRPKYLERVLAYFNNFEYFKPNIFILDSSFEDNKIVNEATVKNLNNDRIKYYHFDSAVNFFKKINFGIEKTTTEYLALCADDDFLTEEGLIESIKTLESNKDLYSVKGKNLYFVKSMSNIKEYDFFPGLYENDSIDRLHSMTKGFVATLMYQVFTIEKYKIMYKFLEDNRAMLPENNTFQEYLFYFMVILTGKIGKINVDLNIRDKSVPRAFESFKNFPHAIMDGSFNDDYKKFCEFLNKYSKQIGKCKKDFNKNISEIFCNFLINFLGVERQNVISNNNQFDLKQLEIGMRKTWVWPKEL